MASLKTNSVLKYAVARSSGIKGSAEEWPLYESFLLNSLMGEAVLFPVFAQIMLKSRDEGYPVNLDKLATTLGRSVNTIATFNRDMRSLGHCGLPGSFACLYRMRLRPNWRYWMTQSLRSLLSTCVIRA